MLKINGIRVEKVQKGAEVATIECMHEGHNLTFRAVPDPVFTEQHRQRRSDLAYRVDIDEGIVETLLGDLEVPTMGNDDPRESLLLQIEADLSDAVESSDGKLCCEAKKPYVYVSNLDEKCCREELLGVAELVTGADYRVATLGDDRESSQIKRLLAFGFTEGAKAHLVTRHPQLVFKCRGGRYGISESLLTDAQFVKIDKD